MSPIDDAWLILKVDDRAIRADEAASEMVRRAQREENRKKEMKDWANQLRGNAPFDMKERKSGSMRETLIPEDKENPIVKYPLDFRQTKLGQLPINMAISRALANMGYPILPETPYDYDDIQGFRVQQPQIDMRIPPYRDVHMGHVSSEEKAKMIADKRKQIDELKRKFTESPMINLVTPHETKFSSDYNVLDTYGGNVGFHEDKPVNFDPRYGQELDAPGEHTLETTYADLSNTINQPFKPKSWAPQPVGQSTSGHITHPQKYKERLQDIKAAKDEIPTFLEEYKKPGFFDDWINVQENQQVIPGHQKQLDEGLANYRNFGDALEFHNTLVNDPAQTRLYEFSDPAYARSIQQLQEMVQ